MPFGYWYLHFGISSPLGYIKSVYLTSVRQSRGHYIHYWWHNHVLGATHERNISWLLTFHWAWINWVSPWMKPNVNSTKHLTICVSDRKNIHSDWSKTKVLACMPVCSSAAEVRQFHGMSNHLGKFIPKLAQQSLPLQQLQAGAGSSVGMLFKRKPLNAFKLNSPAH